MKWSIILTIIHYISFVLLSAPRTGVVAHEIGPTEEEQHNGRNIFTYRVLSAEYSATEIGIDNVTDHRRLTDNYFETIRRYVTPRRIEQLLTKHKYYHRRAPFPHAAIDGFFPESVIEAIQGEVPDSAGTRDVATGKEANCIKGANVCQESEYSVRKSAYNHDKYFGPATASMIAYMKSTTFVQFLERMSGIRPLIPDPVLAGAGVHQTLRDGLLKVHADFNVHPQIDDLHRRVNILLFLNPDWQEEYGGHLELWNRNLTLCQAKVLPISGRLAMFNSNDFSYHGHQVPLSAPEGRSRRSIAMYYYTTRRPEKECDRRHTDCKHRHVTLWQETKCPGCEDRCAMYHIPRSSTW